MGDDGRRSQTYTSANTPYASGVLTGFLVNPEGTIINAVYSTGPIGRFTASEILRKVRFEMDKPT